MRESRLAAGAKLTMEYPHDRDEAARLIRPVQTLKVDRAAIHDLTCAGSRNALIEDVDVVQFASARGRSWCSHEEQVRGATILPMTCLAVYVRYRTKRDRLAQSLCRSLKNYGRDARLKTDGQLPRNVLEKLNGDPIVKPPCVRVRTMKGVAVLSGRAADHSKRSAVEAAASCVTGILSVSPLVMMPGAKMGVMRPITAGAGLLHRGTASSPSHDPRGSSHSPASGDGGADLRA